MIVKRYLFTLFACLVASLGLSAPAGAASVTLSETTFAAGTVTQVVTYTSGASQAGAQVGALGNEAFQIRTTGGGGTRNAWFFDGVSYDPRRGPISTLDVSFSYLNALRDGRNMGLGLVVRQDGDLYITSTSGPAQPGGTFAVTGLTAADLTRVVGLATRSGDPDFSTSGGLLEFGLYTFNGSGNDITYQYDDFTVTLQVAPVPLPAGLGLLTVALGGLGLVARRRAGAQRG